MRWSELLEIKETWRQNTCARRAVRRTGHAALAVTILMISAMAIGCSDGDGGGSLDTNHPPVVLPPTNTTVQPGDTMSVNLTVTDPDGDNVVLELAGSPTGAALDGTTVTWNPTQADVGTHDFLVTATDDGVPPLTGYALFVVRVEGSQPGENHPPVFMPVANQTVTLGNAVNVTLEATDPDGDTLTYGLTVGPAAASVTGDQFTWTPAAGDAGDTHWIVVSVTDSGSPPMVAYQGFAVEVVDPNAPGVNHAPQITPVADQLVLAGDAVAFTVSASDPDNDNLTLDASMLPTGATFDGQTGSFNWTTSAADVGMHFVQFQATDDGSPNLSDIVLVHIEVVSATSNQPPTFVDWPTQTTIEACVPFNYALMATDPENGVLTYSSPNLPTDATLLSDGSFDWTPSFADVGLNNIMFSVSDDGTPALWDSIMVAFDVTPPTSLPVTTQSFTNLGTFSTPVLTLDSIDITGSADVYVLNLNGLGIVGGIFTNTIDGSEWIQFAFPTATIGVSYFVNSAGNQDGDGFVGEAFIEAFDAQDASLGVVPVNGTGDKDVSVLFGNVPILRFRVQADVDNHRIASLDYVRCW